MLRFYDWRYSALRDYMNQLDYGGLLAKRARKSIESVLYFVTRESMMRN